MKHSGLFILFCAFFFHVSPISATAPANDPEIKVVVTSKRIWLVTDEMPVKKLVVQVCDTQGKVVLERQFSSQTADWSVDLTDLPAGKYSVTAGKQAPIRFSK